MNQAVPQVATGLLDAMLVADKRKLTLGWDKVSSQGLKSKRMTYKMTKRHAEHGTDECSIHNASSIMDQYQVQTSQGNINAGGVKMTMNTQYQMKIN